MSIKLYFSIACLFLFFTPIDTTAATDHATRIKSYLDSAALSSEAKDPEQACGFYQKAIRLQDSIAQKKYAQEVKQLRSAAQIDELYLQNTRQKNKILTTVLILMGILSVFATGALLYLRKKNRRMEESRRRMYEARMKSEASLLIKKQTLRELTDEVEHALDNIEKARRMENVKKEIISITSRFFMLLVLLLPFAFSGNAMAQKQRDSLTTLLTGMPAGREKLQKMLQLVKQYNTGEYAEELVEMFITEAQQQKNDTLELQGLSLAFGISYAKANIEEAEAVLNRLKDASPRLDKSYNRYYRLWGSFMQLLASQGNTEKVKDESRKMRLKAEEENNITGKVTADLALSNAYYFLKDNASAARILEKTLEEKDISPLDLLSIYKRLYSYYQNLKEYNKSTAQLDQLNPILKNLDRESEWLDYHVKYALVSSLQKKYDQMYHHLKEAKKYYRENCFISTFVMYHNVWALYYEYTKDWEKCIREYDVAIERLKSTQPMMKLAIQQNKAESLRKAGKSEESLKEYQAIYTDRERLNKEFLQKQAFAIDENYRWELGLVAKAKNEHLVKIVIAAFISLLLFVLGLLLLRILRINKKLLELEQQTAQSASVAAQADKFREILIKNTQAGLSKPVKEMSALLQQGSADNSENRMIQEQILLEIKQIARKMFPLIKDVKELTFLESGQTLYTLGEYDVLALCYPVVETQKQNPRLEISFISDIESQMIRTDKEKFLTFLSSIFLLPQNHKLTEKIEIILSYGNTGNEVVLSVIGTFLAKDGTLAESYYLKNEINRLFIESLGGKYQLKKSSLRPELTVTLPFYR